MLKQALRLKTFWLFLVFVVLLVIAINTKPINWDTVVVCITWLIVSIILVPIELQKRQ